uniref:Protein Wnt n=1 Tax=Glossina austeni TaxID=7395 RepID=A0A1A9UTZ6_GLOAU
MNGMRTAEEKSVLIHIISEKENLLRVTNPRLDCLPDGRATCRSVPGLTKDQLELCYKASDVTAAALEGLDLAIKECQAQFQWHRWNCSSLNTKSRNPHASNLLKKGT